jgi:hypothetical protein
MTLRQLRNEFSVARKLESVDCWLILGWVDPDFGCRRQRARNALNGPLWVAGMSGGQHGGPRLEDCRGLAGVHDSGSQQADAPVSVLLAMPVKEPTAERNVSMTLRHLRNKFTVAW